MKRLLGGARATEWRGGGSRNGAGGGGGGGGGDAEEVGSRPEGEVNMKEDGLCGGRGSG